MRDAPSGYRVNRLIDQVLMEPGIDRCHELEHLARQIPVQRLAERIRQRATALGKPQRAARAALLARRDALIEAVYAAVVPTGWSCAWIDGASRQSGTRRNAGIGGILLDSDGRRIAQISRAIGEQDAFGAELAALTAMIRCALEHRQPRLWVYTDNDALIHLWQEQREDRSLDEVYALVGQLEKFVIQAIPRLHNQPSNTLARAAIAPAQDRSAGQDYS